MARTNHPVQNGLSETRDQRSPANARARSSTVEQGTFNPLVPGSNPGGLTGSAAIRDRPRPRCSQVCSQNYASARRTVGAYLQEWLGPMRPSRRPGT